MPTLAVVGRIAPRSQPAAMFVGGVQVQPTREPIAAQLCPCGRVGCDCDEWHEIAHTSPFDDVCDVCGGIGCDCITPTAQAALLARIDADPHGYNDLTNLDIPL